MPLTQLMAGLKALVVADDMHAAHTNLSDDGTDFATLLGRVSRGWAAWVGPVGQIDERAWRKDSDHRCLNGQSAYGRPLHHMQVSSAAKGLAGSKFEADGTAGVLDRIVKRYDVPSFLRRCRWAHILYDSKSRLIRSLFIEGLGRLIQTICAPCPCCPLPPPEVRRRRSARCWPAALPSASAWSARSRRRPQ